MSSSQISGAAIAREHELDAFKERNTLSQYVETTNPRSGSQHGLSSGKYPLLELQITAFLVLEGVGFLVSTLSKDTNPATQDSTLVTSFNQFSLN